MTPTILGYARSRIAAALEEVERLDASEFPYQHSKDALGTVRGLLNNFRDFLDSLSDKNSADVIENACSKALAFLFDITPNLGFILRSTNVRNAFEIFNPLLRLARRALPRENEESPNIRMILSSEWDYSPYTDPQSKDLPNYLLIGLPAPESSNPLVIPLAGHEFGHAIWLRKHVRVTLLPQVKTAVLDTIKADWNSFLSHFPYLAGMSQDELTSNLFALNAWSNAHVWAECQAEETFCDCIGILLFGEAFFHAFAYLLSPRAGMRSVRYPNMLTRVKNMVSAASEYGIGHPSDFVATFGDDDASSQLIPGDQYQLSIADSALKIVLPIIIADARKTLAPEISESSRDRSEREAEIKRILLRFKMVIPAEGCKRLSDILVAGWRGYHDVSMWSELAQVYSKREVVLKELLLKNIEVFEFEQIVGNK